MAIFGYFLSVLPAYAGVILHSPRNDLPVRSTSRVCGGDPGYTLNELQNLRYFPRMRG